MTGAPTPPPTLSPRDEVRVSFGLCAKKLGDLAHDLIPPDPAPRPETACAAPSPCASGWTPSLPRPSSPNARRAPAGPPSARPSAASPGSPCTGAGPDDWATAGRRALGGSSGLTAWDAAAALDIAYARLDDDRPRDAFSSGLDAVRFPDAEAARVRRVCAAALEARLRGLKDETDGLTRRFRALAGTAPAARAGALRRRAEVHDAAAGLLDELGKLEPDRADEHRSSAEQYRAEAAADREFADLLARPLPEPGTGRSAPEPQRLADAVEQITREQA